MKLTDKFDNIKQSGTFEIFARTQAMLERGRDVISMVAGELGQNTPDDIANAGIEAIKKGHTKYTVNAGIRELRQAISDKYKKEHDIAYSLDEILVTCGAKQAIYNTINAVVSPDDEVIIFAPYYPSYTQMVKLAGAVPIIVELKSEKNYQIDKEDLENALTEKTAIIILNTPSNPLGTVLTKESLEIIDEVVVSNDLLLISDEIYDKIVYKPAKHISPVDISEELISRTILVNGFSKSYSMTGWRIGYCIGPKEIIRRAGIIQSHSTSNASSIAQHAALKAVENGDKFISSIIKDLEKKRDLASSALNRISNVSFSVPEGAFYLFFDISKILDKIDKFNNSTELALYLLEYYRVAVVPGDAFGAENYLRLSFALSEDKLTEGLKRIKAGLEQISR